jgi:hypothetical protein
MDSNFNHHHRRRERRNQGRAIAANRQTQQTIDSLQENLDLQAANASRAIFLGKRALSQYHEIWNNSEAAYRNPNIRQAITLYSVLLGTVAVVVINLLLIKAPVEYIVKLSGANEFFQTAAAIAVPILLLIFELSTGAQLQQARENDDEDAERTWIMLGWFLIFFTPLMVLGTYIAGGLLDKPANWILMITLMILAGGTDAAIVNGYELIDMARGFAACRLSLKLAKGKVHRQEENFNRAKNRTITVFGRLGRLYERHNESYPQAEIPALSFAHTTGWFVNYSRGEEAIRGLPPRPREMDFDFFTNLDWEQPLPRQRRPQNLGAESPQTDEVNEDENEAAAERDFYREQVRRNAQQDEREVRP